MYREGFCKLGNAPFVKGVAKSLAARPWLHLRLCAPSKSPSTGESLPGLVCSSATCHGDRRSTAEFAGPQTHQLHSQLWAVHLLLSLPGPLFLQACSPHPAILFPIGWGRGSRCPAQVLQCWECWLRVVPAVSFLQRCRWLSEATSASILCPPPAPAAHP